jgi:hypothetical protein
MVYGGAPATDDSDAIRLLIGDISSTGPVFTDAEISYFAGATSNNYYAAAMALEAMAGNIASVNNKKVGDLQLNYLGVATVQDLLNKAKLYRTQAAVSASGAVKPYSGGISVADKDAQLDDTDWDRPAASIGMHDYPGSTAYSTGY